MASRFTLWMGISNCGRAFHTVDGHFTLWSVDEHSTLRTGISHCTVYMGVSHCGRAAGKLKTLASLPAGKLKTRVAQGRCTQLVTGPSRRFSVAAALDADAGGIAAAVRLVVLKHGRPRGRALHTVDGPTGISHCGQAFHPVAGHFTLLTGIPHCG